MRNIKKIFRILIIVCILFISYDVYAGDHSLKELIPVSEEANIIADSFVYSGIKFETGSDNKANSVLRFNAITNNTDTKKVPGFNVLLFDGSMKNIGYITYCASKDYGSDNSNIKIAGKGSLPFKINVSSRYFGANEKDYKGVVHESGEILYYAFLDENKYCQIGGYTKYIGLTLEEIVGGEVTVKNKKSFEKLQLNELILYLPYFLIGLVALIVYGFLLNALYKRMKARTSILSYLPMTNLYISVKLAFGKMIAGIFYFLCLVGFFITYSSGTMTFTYLLCGFVGFATVIDIIKLVTGNYNLLLIGEKSHKSEDFDTNFATNSGSRFIDEDGKDKNNTDKPVTANEFLDSINNGINDKQNQSSDLIDSGDLVDISYSSDVPISEDSIVPVGVDSSNNFNAVNNMETNDVNNTMIQSIPEMNNLVPISNVAPDPIQGSDNQTYNNNSSNTNNTQIPKLSDDDTSGESELSNFFR